MGDIKTQPHFLELKPFHLSVEKARCAVISTLERYEVQRPENGWESVFFKRNDVTPTKSVTFTELIDEARRTGVVSPIQEYFDKNDPVFGGTINEISIPNFQLTHNVEFAGWSKEAQGPCRTSCVEFELTDDILDYRCRTCEHSNEYNFQFTARYFRAYLSSCISIVEAFINRHILLAEYEGFSSPEFEQLKKTNRLEERISLWWSFCSEDDQSSLLQSTAWNHFQELRKKRNEILHAIDPISVYSLKEIQLYLNKVRTGIGEFLLILRRAHQKPTLGFIERLRTAPLVDFMKIRFKSDGPDKMKRQEGC